VASGQCDLGFAVMPIEHAAVEVKRLPGVRFVAVVPTGHRLARRKVLRPRDFHRQAFIALGHSTISRFRLDAVFGEHEIERVMRVETPLSEIACGLVSSGVGLSICDPFTAAEYTTRGIVVRPFEPAIEFEFAVLRSTQRTLPAVAEEFVEAFRRHVAEFIAGRGLD
jgi:DNA-binding transcriptional LysR family regulator